MADNTCEACQITQVESQCVNYWVALWVTCSWFCKLLDMSQKKELSKVQCMYSTVQL